MPRRRLPFWTCRKSLLSSVLANAAGLAAACCAHAQDGLKWVAPGMSQTELQSVMGPPDYIQVKGLRQAWQYCPHFLDGRDDLFVTIWFNNGQVQHLRAYPDEAMGACEDFLAAFRWEDVLMSTPPGPVPAGPVK